MKDTRKRTIITKILGRMEMTALTLLSMRRTTVNIQLMIIILVKKWKQKRRKKMITSIRDALQITTSTISSSMEKLKALITLCICMESQKIIIIINTNPQMLMVMQEIARQVLYQRVRVSIRLNKAVHWQIYSKIRDAYSATYCSPLPV